MCLGQKTSFEECGKPDIRNLTECTSWGSTSMHLESRLLGEISTISDVQREEELKSLLMKVKEGNEKAGFQTQCSKHEDHPLVITHLVLT